MLSATQEVELYAATVRAIRGEDQNAEALVGLVDSWLEAARAEALLNLKARFALEAVGRPLTWSEMDAAINRASAAVAPPAPIRASLPAGLDLADVRRVIEKAMAWERPFREKDGRRFLRCRTCSEAGTVTAEIQHHPDCTYAAAERVLRALGEG